MIGLFYLFAGLAVGSFINCWVYRLDRRLSFVSGRSFCPKCKHKLSWQENIPLFSYFFLKGHCRYCRKPISLHYPLVELATGVLFVLAGHYFASIGYIGLLFYCFIVTCFIAIFVSDWLYFTIPDEIVFVAMMASLAKILLSYWITGLLDYSYFLIALAAGLFFWFLVVITHGRGMGEGDIKLAILIGLVLGYPKTIIALYLAFLTGALIGVILILLKKKKLGEKIAFGPFLSGSAIIILFWGEQIWLNAVLP